MSAEGPWKTALVTGATSGLGRGLAAWLAKRGVKVYAAGRRVELLKSLATEAGVIPFELDVSDGDATFAAVSKLDAECGGLDLVIANAGVGEETRPKKLRWSSIKRMIDVNVTGATATISGAVPGMVERGRGHLVGISSLAGLLPLPANSTYCATKSFVAMFLNSLRLDVEPLGLVVTSIHPGFVKTELTAKNKPGSMPFLLEADDAVERMGKALLRRDAVFSFPWQLTSAIGFASALPRPVQTAVLKKVR